MSDARVYAVASGKGGVGKTTTAVNLGAAAAAAGHTAVVVDVDLGMANVGDFLGLEPETALHDVLAGDAEVADAIVEIAAGFDVLPGGTEIEDFGRVDPAALRPIVEELRETYDLVLLDTGGGLSHDAAVPLGLADEVVLTTTPQAASLGNTKKTEELTDWLDAEIAGVLLTRVGAGDADADAAGPIDAPLLGTIPEDSTVPESQTAGEPLESFAPDAPATQAYRELAATLLDIPLPRNWETSEGGGFGPSLADDAAGASATGASATGPGPTEPSAADAGAGEGTEDSLDDAGDVAGGEAVESDSAADAPTEPVLGDAEETGGADGDESADTDAHGAPEGEAVGDTVGQSIGAGDDASVDAGGGDAGDDGLVEDYGGDGPIEDVGGDGPIEGAGSDGSFGDAAGVASIEDAEGDASGDDEERRSLLSRLTGGLLG